MPLNQRGLELVAKTAPLYAAIPAASNSFVCPRCLGPFDGGFSQCSGCVRLFSGVAASLRGMVVPMFAALTPSQGYTWLSTYKNGFEDRAQDLAALFVAFVETNEQAIRKQLGGPVDVVTTVPSKRGVPFERQVLPRIVRAAPALKPLMAQTLEHDPSQTVARQTYSLTVFRPAGGSVSGRRVLLVEDTWVSGSTAISAAATLLEAGAASVLVLPFARLIRETFWPEEHPYRMHMKKVRFDPFSVSSWARP